MQVISTRVGYTGGENQNVTEISAAGPFWEAEAEDQDYLQRYPDGYTCHFPRPGWKLPRRETAAYMTSMEGR
jgi:peptide methionine sulfoxide reductase MsrA